MINIRNTSFNSLITKSTVNKKQVNFGKTQKSDEFVFSKAKKDKPKSELKKILTTIAVMAGVIIKALVSFVKSKLSGNENKTENENLKTNNNVKDNDVSRETPVKTVNSESEVPVSESEKAEISETDGENTEEPAEENSEVPKEICREEAVLPENTDTSVSKVEVADLNPVAEEKPKLTDEEKIEVLASSGVENAAKVLSKISKYDDEFFGKLTTLLRSGGRCDTYTDFEIINNADEKAAEKACKLALAGKTPIDAEYACIFGELEDENYNKLYAFREAGGEIDNKKAAELYSLDDEKFASALNVTGLLSRQEYVTDVVSDSRKYDCAQKLIDLKAFDNVKTYQNRHKLIKNLSSCDEKAGERYFELLQNGFETDNDIFKCSSPGSLKKLSELTPEQFQKSLHITEDKLAKELNYIIEFSEFDDKKFQRVLDLQDFDLSDITVHTIVGVDDDNMFERTKNLIANGLDGETVHSRINKLNDEEYETVSKLVKAGGKSFYKMCELIDLKDKKAEERALKALEIGVPGYDFVSCAKLSGEQFEAEIDKLQKIAAGLKFEPEAKAEKLPEITEQDIAEIVDELNKSGVECTVKTPIDTIAFRWKNKYISGVNPLSRKNTEKIIPYACERFVAKNNEPLSRRLKIFDTEKFVASIPNPGEIYSYPEIQSFAKTAEGAEILSGNNFSDSNPDINAKFIVYPKNSVTEAYDTGEGKYGSDEAIYKPGQNFRVLYKGNEEINGRNMYVVYMQEA